MTKNELRAALDLAGIAYPRKATLAQLQALLPAPATAPEGKGLRIEKDRPERNGVKRPSAGGKCRAVWDALDAYRAEVGEVPSASVVRELAADMGWNPNNASIEFYQWRKYNGITGRTPKRAAPAPEAEATTD